MYPIWERVLIFGVILVALIVAGAVVWAVAVLRADTARDEETDA